MLGRKGTWMLGREGTWMLGRKGTWMLAALAASAVGPGIALAHQPQTQRFEVDETFVDGFLSEQCGVLVTTALKGHVILRTHSGHGTGVAQVRTINVAVTSSAGDNTYRFRDVGADVLRTEPDGTVVLSIVGQVPFTFNGVLKVDPATDEVLHEPQKLTGDELEKACAALTA